MTYCMQMSLDFTNKIPWVLFENWNATSPGLYFGSLVFAFTLAFIVEAVPFIRWYEKNREEQLEKQTAANSSHHINKSELQDKNGKHSRKILVLKHLLDTVLQFIAKTSTYFLMLIAMTYNFGIIAIFCVGFAGSNLIFELIKDRIYIKQRMLNLGYKKIAAHQ
eukprot:403371539